ncbi:cytochrome-c oxidase, cbb3-type subunit III [Ideonella sp. 4Y11]|uniref:Cbb3-type cytochrome c oxidase subunit n=1 Tax=Ideonella aquatica TaxID=2824119 RepID=A0A940YIR6_9BURK|nr:cytochrome-c oxidase, cbb3-type subunit III [Ideonella aquatica]MBQ0959447.1 cytochrome-c oxidase, cbb3-type subunit III [Ideonella aquatica]
MSDFVSSFWSLYVVAIVAGGLVFCLAVLIGASKHRPMADDNSTGHTWDGDLRELNNPLPRWWMGLFLITVVFAIAYLALYPGFGAAEGGLKWSSAGQLQAEQAKAAEAMKAVYAEFNGQAPEALAKNPKAMAIGERLFVNNCAQCHGSDARGSKSFPNLADNDWLGGDGSPAYIEKTIVEGRQGVMPPMAAAVGTPEDVKAVANYVLSLSGGAHNSVAAQVGKAKFAACAACHGPEGKGTQALGAPNLTDKIWLHGWGEAQVISMINNGKTNVMPAQGARFTPDQLKVLTAYVWNLSQSTSVAAQ